MNERVIAIRNCDKENVYIFGYGTHIGDKPIPKEICDWLEGVPNPCIELDNGKTVWGMECWWTDIEAAKKTIKGLNVIEIDIDEYRKENK